MPKKLEKWGLKVWFLACSISKYVWNIKVYCRKENMNLVHVENVNPNLALICCGELRLAHYIVLRMVEGLAYVEHL